MALKAPFDVDAIEVEASGTPFKFTFGGETYTVPAIVDFKITAHLRRGDFASAIEAMVGPEQWQKILASDAVLNLERANAIVTAFAEHVGTTVGKSRASRRSSKSTAAQ